MSANLFAEKTPKMFRTAVASTKLKLSNKKNKKVHWIYRVCN